MAINSINEFSQRLSKQESGQPYKNDESMMDSMYNIPGYALNAAEELPEKIWGMVKQIPSTAKKMLLHPEESARDFGGGVARGSQRLSSALGETGQYLSDNPLSRYLNKKIPDKYKFAPDVNIREELGLGNKNPVDLGKMIESNNPDPLLSGGGQFIGAAALGTRIPALIASSAVTGAIQANPGERVQGATEGAVNAALPMAAGKTLAKGFDVARPSNLLRGNLSPQELQANLSSAEGTQTGLGDVIGSPTLKRLYENTLPHIPFSDAYTTMQKAASQVAEKGEKLMDKIGEKLPAGDKTKILQDALKSASNQARKEKQADYSKVNKIADDIGLTVGRTKFQSKAQSVLDNLDKSPELKREFPSDILSDIKEYAKNTKGNTLELSNIFRGKLGSKASTLYREGNTHEYGIIKDLQDALDSDIKSAIKGSGHKDLMSEYKNAQSNYGSKYAPFEHPDLTKFTREGGDADLMLSHFLRTGTNDRGALIQRLTTKLPSNLRQLPLHMYLSRAIEDGKLNPIKLKTLYDKLGEKQRNALIPDKAMRKEIENYTNLVGMNKEGFHTMFNPKTGQRNLDSMVGAIEALGGYGALGSSIGVVPAAIAGVLGTGLVGKGATKLLTSEKIRNALVKKMTK